MEPCYLYIGDFSRDEMAVLDQWSERMNEAAEEEGRPLDFYGDCIPILFGVLHSQFDFDQEKRLKISEKLSLRMKEAINLFHADAAGRA